MSTGAVNTGFYCGLDKSVFFALTKRKAVARLPVFCSFNEFSAEKLRLR